MEKGQEKLGVNISLGLDNTFERAKNDIVIMSLLGGRNISYYLIDGLHVFDDV